MHAGLLQLAFAGILCAQASDNNLDLRRNTLSGWEGHGFFLVSADAQGSAAKLGLSSEDAASESRKGMLRNVFVVPEGAGRITFQARAVNSNADGKLDVMLLARGRKVMPKSVLSQDGWMPVEGLVSQSREYSWDVANLVGQTLQVVLFDEDDAPGHHVVCSAFSILPSQDPVIEQFVRQMVALQEKHNLNAMYRYDSKRFTALSNAGEKFSVACLRNCELMHDLFYDHFGVRGFALEQPRNRLMVAAFDTPQGFEAYLDRKISPTFTGVYHPQSNRLVVYDLQRNKSIVAERDKALQFGSKIGSEFKRATFVETIERQARDRSEDANLTTIMHEVAHQLSFNSGLLQRNRDVPIWLGEGLACYCEATEDGSWRGIGALNRPRLDTIQHILRDGGSLLPPEELFRGDGWRNDSKKVLLGYAQSWALFHMLMHEQPKQLRDYCDLISSRRTPEYRLLDFCQIFGSDLRRFEQRHVNYVRQLLEKR